MENEKQNMSKDIQHYIVNIEHSLDVFEEDKSPSLKNMIESDFKKLDILVNQYLTNYDDGLKIQKSYEALKKRYEVK